MQEWAQGLMDSRPADVVIGRGTGTNGRDYVQRWHVVPHNSISNVYLHLFGRSDEDRALHDHPWNNTSFIIKGRYREHLATGQHMLRVAGDFIRREAKEAHRVELIHDEPVVSLFVTGPKIREWGFECPGGWRHWLDFEASGGCGFGDRFKDFQS